MLNFQGCGFVLVGDKIFLINLIIIIDYDVGQSGTRDRGAE